MPSAQLSCINDYILLKLREFNAFGVFRQRYVDLMMNRADMRFRSMYWHWISYQFPSMADHPDLVYREMVYQIDTDKVSYVMLLSPSITMGAEAEQVINNTQRNIEKIGRAHV